MRTLYQIWERNVQSCVELSFAGHGEMGSAASTLKEGKDQDFCVFGLKVRSRGVLVYVVVVESKINK